MVARLEQLGATSMMGMSIQRFSQPVKPRVIFSLANAAGAIAVQHGEAVSADVVGGLLDTLAASGKLVAIEGSYKGQPECSFILPLHEFREAYSRSEAVRDAINLEETVLVLGAVSGPESAQMDSRGRPSAFLISPSQTDAAFEDLLAGFVADLGYFGSLDNAEDREAFDAWTLQDGVAFVAMPSGDWQTYEDLQRNWGGFRALGPEWRSAKPMALTAIEREAIAAYRRGEV